MQSLSLKILTANQTIDVLHDLQTIKFLSYFRLVVYKCRRPFRFYERTCFNAGIPLANFAKGIKGLIKRLLSRLDSQFNILIMARSLRQTERFNNIILDK